MLQVHGKGKESAPPAGGSEAGRKWDSTVALAPPRIVALSSGIAITHSRRASPRRRQTADSPPRQAG